MKSPDIWRRLLAGNLDKLLKNFRLAGEKMPTGSEYLKIPLSEFAEEDSLPMDLYFESEPGKVQKLAQKNSHFSIRHLPPPLKRNLRWIFLKKEDYRLFVHFSVGQGGLSFTSQADLQQKLSRLNQHIEKCLAEYQQQGLSLSSLDLVTNTLNNVLHLVIENPITNKLFEKIEALEGSQLHSISVAVWTQILALRLGWSGEPTAFRVALCTLLHDVGSNENVDKLQQKNPNELSSQDIRLLEGHVLRGRDILSSISGMPAEAITVAHQHHENVDGSGYPQKLFLDNIHPISRLVSLANRFYQIYSNMQKQRSLSEAFQIFKKEQMSFDLRFFKTLEEVLHAQKKS